VLKVRVMPTLLFKNVGLVKGIGFDSWRRVGGVIQSMKVYNLRQVDEMVLLDISATLEGRRPDFQAVDEYADACFVPFTVGGGVRTVDDVKGLLQVGADKVALNTAAFESPELIRESADRFGVQCVVVSIDARRMPDGTYMAFTHAGTRPTGEAPATSARRVAALGAGEILLTSIERDGTMAGYDVELVRQVSSVVDVPVIASGGAGSYEHMYEAITAGGASAVAAASIFHFTEQTPREAKNFLRARGIPVRVD